MDKEVAFVLVALERMRSGLKAFIVSHDFAVGVSKDES
jgi:hypothetical protein